MAGLRLPNQPRSYQTALGTVYDVPLQDAWAARLENSMGLTPSQSVLLGTPNSSKWMEGLGQGSYLTTDPSSISTTSLLSDSNSLGSSLSDLGSGGSEEGSGFFDFLGSDAFGNSLMGLNLLANLGLGIMGGIQANKQYKLANEAFNFNKAATIANMNNAIDSFNQGLYDRLRTRDIMETGTENNFKQQYEKRKMDQFNGQ